MANPTGHVASLVPAPAGNTRNLRHGLSSERLPELVEDRIDEIVAELLALPHTTPLDRPAAEEIARMKVLIERMDVALSDGRLESKRGEKLRALVDQRRRLNANYWRMLESFGGTPESRSKWAARMASGLTFSERVERRMRGEGAS